VSVQVEAMVKYPECVARRKRRQRLVPGVSPAELGGMIGVVGDSVSHWESGRVRPLPEVADRWDAALTRLEVASAAATAAA
jgi:transcriptional regulator with XRE-family HTH domain